MKDEINSIRLDLEAKRDFYSFLSRSYEETADFYKRALSTIDAADIALKSMTDSEFYAMADFPSGEEVARQALARAMAERAREAREVAAQRARERAEQRERERKEFERKYPGVNTEL